MSDHSQLKTPGELISEARVAQDLTLAQLSERTKIPPPVLASLEQDEFHKISGPLYIKSFLRTCALDLGLDPQAVLEQYNRISGENKSGPVGSEMVWKEDEVKVERVGLPWVRIALGVGLAAILVGLGLFILRGCESEPTSESIGPSGTGSQLESAEATVAVVPGDSASGGEIRRESLIPSSTESQLRQRAAAMETRGEAESNLPDSLAVGWLLNPPPAAWEKENSSESETKADHEALTRFPAEMPTVSDDISSTGGSDELAASQVPESADPTEAGEQAAQEILTHEVPTPAAPTQEIPSRDDATEVPAEEVVTGDAPVEILSEPSTPAVVQVDSAWPLVLRVACDVPQKILVKRDGDSQFMAVRWPDGQAVADPVPDAGFEAGRAYRDGRRLVVFWGANDHFSLKLANTLGVEVSINGRTRDIGRLRSGQELILDSHSAGSGSGR